MGAIRQGQGQRGGMSAEVLDVLQGDGAEWTPCPSVGKEVTRADKIAELKRKVVNGYPVLLETLKDCRVMRLRDDVPAGSLAYLAYESQIDGDTYYRQCEVLQVGKHFCQLFMNDTGEKLDGVMRESVHLLLAGRGRVEVARCITCGGDISSKRAGSKYCNDACRMRDSRARRGGR